MMRKNPALWMLFFGLGLIPLSSQAQLPAKQVRQQAQVWLSMNAHYRFNQRWGLIGDLHIRRNNFLKDPSFDFARLGVSYWFSDKMFVAAGYGHLWTAPAKIEWNTWGNEHRFYQQFQFNGKLNKTNVSHRIRNEQRWQQVIVDDAYVGRFRFSNRVRYQVSFGFPIFKNPKAPVLILSDELLIQFGKELVYNTFDQNRLFIGIRQNISKQVSFDFGYMNVYQQRITGYQYDMNHTIRLFFYYQRVK